MKSLLEWYRKAYHSSSPLAFLAYPSAGLMSLTIDSRMRALRSTPS